MPTLSAIGLRLRRAAVYSGVLLRASVSSSQRRLLREIFSLGRELPQRLDTPLPEAMAALTPAAVSAMVAPATICRLVDAACALGAGRPLGICLRRSLLRYYFLRRAGLPLVVHFGARRLGEAVGGHAWLTLNGRPYHENPAHVLPHTLMWSYPPPAGPEPTL